MGAKALTVIVGVALALAVGSAALAGVYEDQVLADNPVAYWRFEDGRASQVMPTGAPAADAAGANAGTYQNSVLLVAGITPGSTAPDFNGLDNFVRTTTLGNFGSGLAAGSTLEFWAKTTEPRVTRQPMGVLNQADATAFVVDFNRDSNLNGSVDRYNFYLRGSDGKQLSTHTLGPDYRDGEWHHHVWVVNDPATNDVDLYRDGVLISQGQSRKQNPTSFTNLEFPLLIGANNNRGTPAAHTDTAIDEVAIYNKPLTAAQVAAHYNAQRADAQAGPQLPVGGGLLMHLAGDSVAVDGSGKVATWTDLSGSGNDAVQNVNTSLRPTPIPAALNGHQVLRFEHEDIMDIADLPIGPDATILMVTQNAQQTSGGSIHRTVMAPRLGPEPYSAAGNGYALGYFRDGADAFNVSLGNGSAEQTVTDPLDANGQFEIVAYRHAATLGEVFRDGVLAASGPQTRTSGFHTGDYSIGRQAGNTQRGYQGDIAEIIVFNRSLSDDEIDQIGLYLEAKYGLNTLFSLPTRPIAIGHAFNADTIATSASDAAGAGYRGSLNEKFLTGAQFPTDRVLRVSNGLSYPLGPYDGNNTILMDLNDTETIDIVDAQYTEISILHTAVGFNTIDGAPNETNGILTLHYTDGTSDQMLWDLADNDGNNSQFISLDALEDLTLFRFGDGGGQWGSRQLWSQTFAVDGGRILDWLEFSTLGVSDPSNDADFGIYAISGVLIPEPASMALLALGLSLLAARRRGRAA